MPNQVGSHAGDLAFRFAIAGDRPWVRTQSVRIGDNGWTPFSTPGVVVWDGGSIMGDRGIDPGKGFARRTLAQMRYSSRLFVSATPGADTRDMIREAAAEVDARFVDTADARICVVQGGVGDLKHGAPVDEVIADVVRYCEGRRAAGFKVVVVSLLPRSGVPGFNPARRGFNELLRQQWPAFADGLVDIAADHRIGDDGDNMSRYYRGDQKHPNARGCAVMAAIAAPVLDGLAWRTSQVAVRMRSGEGSWTAWRQYESQFPWQLELGDGKKHVDFEYRDATGDVLSASDAVGLDTSRPAVRAATSTT